MRRVMWMAWGAYNCTMPAATGLPRTRRQSSRTPPTQRDVVQRCVPKGNPSALAGRHRTMVCACCTRPPGGHFPMQAFWACNIVVDDQLVVSLPCELMHHLGLPGRLQGAVWLPSQVFRTPLGSMGSLSSGHSLASMWSCTGPGSGCPWSCQ